MRTRVLLAALVAALAVPYADSILALGGAAAAGTGISLGLGGAGGLAGGLASGLAAVGLLGKPVRSFCVPKSRARQIAFAMNYLRAWLDNMSIERSKGILTDSYPEPEFRGH